MARKPLAVTLADVAPAKAGINAPAIEIEGARIARGLGLGVDDFRQLMANRKITVLCERGTGEDTGLYRASFYFDERRVRLVVDHDGRVLSELNT